MSFTDPAAGIAVIDATPQAETQSYVDWAAIFAGAVLASAISFVLMTFGSAIGLSLTSPYEGESVSMLWLAVGAGLWILWVQVSSFMAGGYLAGRMRRRVHDSTPHEVDIRDGSHGLLVWGLGVFFIGLIALVGAGGAGAVATGSAATVAASAMEASDEGDGGAYDIYIDRLFRTGAPSEVPEATRGEVERILTASLAAGEVSDADRQYLTTLVSATTGADEASAQQRVDALVTDATAAEAQAKEAADAARRATMIAAFLTAASLLVSAAGAYFAAGMGGNHRDEGTEFAHWVRR
jgi:hypothetical protein